ncbi:MAG: hypothetical protein IPG99_11630 [Ignavibacteria bacterium]|nr:hypothetical protein [Ignavibacteria bacterium]
MAAEFLSGFGNWILDNVAPVYGRLYAWGIMNNKVVPPCIKYENKSLVQGFCKLATKSINRRY